VSAALARIAFEPNRGLAASVQMLLALQHLNIAMAKHRGPPDIGTPRFKSKVFA
jgi:hypothetical protein